MDILSKITILLEKDSWGKVTHPGLLEVPDGKDIQSLPLKHFVRLAKKKGYGAIVRGLQNLVRWNKNSNPKLSSWAKEMYQQLSAAFMDK